MAAKEVLNDILQSVQNSKLNFSMNLTPFSAYITIRSNFIKNYSPPATIPQLVSQTPIKLEADFHVLFDKNQQLLLQIKKLDETNKTSTNTVKILEEKVSKAEASAFKSFEEKSQEIFCLKKAIKTKDSELACLQKEIKLANKALKEKEKEEYRLGQKNENLAENIQKFKSEISTLKSENKKLLKKNSSRSSKSVNMSTNTSPVTQSKSTCQTQTKNSAFTPLDSPSTNPLISTTQATTSNSSLCSNSTLPVIKECKSLAKITSASPLSTNSSTATNNNNLPAPAKSPSASDLDILTWPPLVTNNQTLNTPCTPYASIPSNSLMTSVDSQTVDLSMIAIDHAEEFRKQQEKWFSILEENDRKREEIFKKIFERLDAEESEHDQNVSN